MTREQFPEFIGPDGGSHPHALDEETDEVEEDPSPDLVSDSGEVTRSPESPTARYHDLVRRGVQETVVIQIAERDALPDPPCVLQAPGACLSGLEPQRSGA